MEQKNCMIVYIDKDESIREALYFANSILKESTVCFSDLNQAVCYVETKKVCVFKIFLDCCGLNDDELRRFIKNIRDINPKIKIIGVVETSSIEGVDSIIKKPFSIEDLIVDF
jgi:DNA-binding NtrC family response regulator